jgi:hypothetical protein
MIKQIMIPVAAFAITATGVSAFNGDMLDQIDVNLTDSQVSALETAHEMKANGTDRDEVKTYLEENGVDSDTIKEIRQASREVRQAQREAVRTALESDDYNAFLAAIADSPLSESITSEADFAMFQEAHELRASGDKEGVQELLAELGIEKSDGRGHKGGHRGGGELQGEQAAE